MNYSIIFTEISFYPEASNHWAWILVLPSDMNNPWMSTQTTFYSSVIIPNLPVYFFICLSTIPSLTSINERKILPSIHQYKVITHDNSIVSAKNVYTEMDRNRWISVFSRCTTKPPDFTL